jgi:uncharacterized membrane protein
MPASSKRSQSGEAVSAGTLNLARTMLGCALVVDLYLAWVSSRGGAIAGCGPASSCHAVLNSRWAYWLSLPVSWPAALVYSIVLVATLRLEPKNPIARKLKAWLILIPCSTAIIVAALWFVSLQLFVLRTICPFCMMAHGCGLLGAGLLLAKAPVRRVPEKETQGSQQVFVSPKLALNLCLGALIAASLLIAGQIFRPAKTYLSAAIIAGVTTNLVQPAVREFQVLDGRFRLKLDQVPLMGRPDAAHTIVSLFDYTCHRCREMHAPLMRAYRQFSNELAIVSLPMPLDERCNPVVRQTSPPHTNACALARIGLTVWLANREAAPKFDDWMFAPAQPPTPAAAEQYARQLVGDQAFRTASTNAWIGRQIRQDVALYEAFYRQFHKAYLPEILIGTNLVSGAFSHDHMSQVLFDQFGLNARRESTNALAR